VTQHHKRARELTTSRLTLISTLMVHSSQNASIDFMLYVLITNSSTYEHWRIVTPTSSQTFSLDNNYLESNKWTSSTTYGLFLQIKTQ
jgi:hypothetical protein